MLDKVETGLAKHHRTAQDRTGIAQVSHRTVQVSHRTSAYSEIVTGIEYREVL